MAWAWAVGLEELILRGEALTYLGWHWTVRLILLLVVRLVLISFAYLGSRLFTVGWESEFVGGSVLGLVGTGALGSHVVGEVLALGGGGGTVGREDQFFLLLAFLAGTGAWFLDLQVLEALTELGIWIGNGNRLTIGGVDHIFRFHALLVGTRTLGLLYLLLLIANTVLGRGDRDGIILAVGRE